MPTLQFKGKSFVQNHHLTVKYHELIPVPEKSLTNEVSLNDNLIIHGDNLVALKALLPIYAGQVKCIYIDPPYNTGEEKWVYNDNVNSPMMRDWLGKVVDKEDLTRHDKWLCMMMPRLKLLHMLLSEEGAIFVSIDDNEVHHLRPLLDDIFGENNFIASLVWQKKVSPSNDAKWFSSDHEYVVVYAKKKDIWRPNRLERTAAQLDFYQNPDNDPRGPWNSVAYTCNKSKEERPNLFYPIRNPNTGQVIYPKETAVWAYSETVYRKHVAENRLYWGKDGTSSMPRLKRFLSEVGNVVPRSILPYAEVGHTQEATSRYREIFPNGGFSYPKPPRLIERILSIATNPDEEDIVLDSFAGSGTTAHAVLEANSKDGGNRRFILIEMENYADTITAERVRRVIQGVPAAKDAALRNGLGGTFSYFELGQAIDPEGLLSGDALPPYAELARYVFYTATGEPFQADRLVQRRWFIGESREYEVYLLYRPDLEALKSLALTLEFAQALGRPTTPKKRLVFAPANFLPEAYLEEYRIEYAQLPYDIYRNRR
ncbi:Site-specific DNA-methyltransferase (adenine- specific) [Sulfobacillus acidophilus TPY]|uniref:DNA methylase N-4/N-6 domain protein n=1 Tax=Sulfobacillus acidophilus (strain ATCC 700253 / DSM 10332 / NAL) TaxID=679936 RepID=G8TY55_SULAD|nr:Site-specific DNA-methyltransferase (adenine- specific) [Sulfobacillus acidophilus TPY]AEW03962.1 DNA methylase N-4/N-6 domain protein [Sulfobacillus acidophilus DSM 10332]